MNETPTHYTHHRTECIDEMVEVFGLNATIEFCKLNVWKYRYRAGAKGTAEDMQKDIEKADNYISILRKLNEEKRKGERNND